MKKKILTITLLAIALCLSFSVFNQVNAEEAVEGDALSTLISSTDGGEVKLTQDYTINSTVTISKSITLDLNGHSIKTTSSFNTDHQAMLKVDDSSVNVTIKDSSASKSGTIEFSEGKTEESGVVDVCAVFVRQGSVTIEGGTFKSTKADNKWGVIEIGHGSNDGVVAGHLTMTGGTISSERFGIVLENGTLTVKSGATIKSVSATIMTRLDEGGNPGFNGTEIKIEGGTIESEGNNAIQNRSKGNVTISGGNITGATAVYSAGGKLTITGGTLTANGNEVKNGYEDDVKDSAAVVVNNNKDPDATAIINGATVYSETEPIMYAFDYKGDNVIDVLNVKNAVSNKEINPEYVSSGLKLKITSNGKGTYYTGEQDDNNIKQALINVKKGETITVLGGDLKLEGVTDGVVVENKGTGKVSVNGIEVKESVVVPEEEKPEEQNKNPQDENAQKEDTTVAKDELPNTGIKVIAMILIISLIVISIVLFKRYKLYKDIK